MHPLPTADMGGGSDSGNGLVRVIGRVMDARHRIPGNGSPYFASRYLHANSRAAFASHATMQVLFDYAGQYNSQRDDDDDDAILVETPWAGKPFDQVRTGARWAPVRDHRRRGLRLAKCLRRVQS
jgi:hypothetical protein